MEVICKPVGPVQANCYIVMDNGHALVIDPGDEANRLEDVIRATGSIVDGIVLTHGHFDHIGAVDELAKAFDTQVYINPKEMEYLADPKKNASASFMGIPRLSLATTPIALKEGENTIGTFTFNAYTAPGHSIGSTILEIGDNLFTGDVLFAGSIGRTDLPSGSVSDMRDSLAYLKSLKKDYVVYPGHGPSTTLDQEKATNPYLMYSLI